MSQNLFSLYFYILVLIQTFSTKESKPSSISSWQSFDAQIFVDTYLLWCLFSVGEATLIFSIFFFGKTWFIETTLSFWFCSRRISVKIKVCVIIKFFVLIENILTRTGCADILISASSLMNHIVWNSLLLPGGRILFENYRVDY